MSDPVVRRIIVHGRVQGVGYRAWTRHVARGRFIDGWVRNRKDGSVEAVFAGTQEAVSGMIDACRKGPSGARVDRIEEHAAAAADLALCGPNDSFSVLATD